MAVKYDFMQIRFTKVICNHVEFLKNDFQLFVFIALLCRINFPPVIFMHGSYTGTMNYNFNKKMAERKQSRAHIGAGAVSAAAAAGRSSKGLGGSASSSSLAPVVTTSRIKLLSIGSGGTGKSCLIKRYCEDRFVSKYIATIGIDYGVKPVSIDGSEVRVNFWDLSGIS
jgi:hypothetical protein